MADISKIKLPNDNVYNIKDSKAARNTVFGASGTNHSTGLVPDPGSTAGSSKFLREDATWQTISGTDEKVKQTLGSADSTYPLLASAQSSPTSGTAYESIYDSGIKINPNKHSLAEGYNCSASASRSHAEGYSTTASENQAHAEGTYTIASGFTSHTEGQYTKASGNGAHAEGYAGAANGIHASGSGSHACGYAESSSTITASGYGSFAGGYAESGGSTISSNTGSFAYGLGVTADRLAMAAFGKYNAASNSGDLFAIGNGSGTSSRSNVMTVNTDGNVTIGSITTGGNLNIVTSTSGVPSIRLQRGSMNDDFTDFLIYDQTGNLKIDKNVSGTQTNLFNLNENGNLSIYGKVSAAKLYSNVRLYNVALPESNPYSATLNTVGWHKVAELNGAIGINGTLRIATIYANTRPESYIVNFAEAWDDANNGCAVNAMIFGDGPRNNANAIIDKIGFIKSTASPYTLGIYMHYNTTVANNVAVALEAGDNNSNGTTLFVPTYDSTKTDSSFGYVYKTRSGLNIKTYNNDFVTFSNEINIADVTSTNTLHVNYRGSTNAINTYKFCNGQGMTLSTIECARVNATNGFFQTSDITKKNIISGLDLNKAYELVDKCQTIIYTLKDDSDNKEQIGMIAQEIQEFFPEIITESADGTLSLDYARLTVVIFKILKDLISRISKLEERIK